MKYKLTLEMAGVPYKSEGETIDEALAGLNLHWHQIKGKGVVKVSRGKSYYEHLFLVRQLRKIFANKLTRALWGKRLEFLMKETAAMNDHL